MDKIFSGQLSLIHGALYLLCIVCHIYLNYSDEQNNIIFVYVLHEESNAQTS